MVMSNETLRKICIENDWFNDGSNSQYEKLFYANRHGCPLDEIVTIIWLCTDCESVGTCRRDIKAILEEAVNRENKDD